ncbi:MAG: CD1871A family CXXC motif-containing protein [Lachnospiraceae bacterium]|nr:CD1871A family CXXC motif-containing protein [Lachnospiraceae bacterium]
MKLPLRIACLFTACAFVVFGVRRGEALVVQNKAVNICLECIGLG